LFSFLFLIILKKKKTPVHFLTGMDGDLRALLWSLNFYRASCSATKQKNKEREREREREENSIFSTG
jgi:hypothetical protein